MWRLLTKLRCCGDDLVLSGDAPSPHARSSATAVAVSPMLEQHPVLEFNIPRLDFTAPCSNDLVPKLQLAAPCNKDMKNDPASASTACSPKSMQWPLERCRTPRSRCIQDDPESGSVRRISSRHCPGSGSQAREVKHLSPFRSPRLELLEASPDTDISAIDISTAETEARSPSSISSEIPGELLNSNTTAMGSDLPGPGACLEDIDEVPVLLPQERTRKHFTTMREIPNKQREIGFGHEFAYATEAALGLKGMTVLQNT